MKKNVGSIDKILRIALAVVIFALGLVFQSWWGLLGIIPLFTALINWCPVYMALGISTQKVKESVQN